MMPWSPATIISPWPVRIAAAVVVLAFAVRLPALAQPIGIDQGIFGTAAWGMSEGLRLYSDLWDQKPPGVHLAYRGAFALLGASGAAIFWLDFIAAAACAAFLYIWGKAASSARLGAVAAAVYSVGSLPALRFNYGGFLERAVAESFIAALVTAAAALLCLSVRDRSDRLIPIAALAMGAAGVMKPNALVYGVAFAVWIGFVRDRRVTRGTVALSAVAFLAPGLVVLAWLYLNGSVRDAWIAVVEYNRAYVTAGAGVGHLVLELAKVTWRYVKTDPVWTAGFCAMVAAVAECGRSRRIVPVPALCACWLAASAVAIAANGIRMYSTYFIPPVPALAMAVAWILVEWPGRHRRLLGLSIVAIAVAVAGARGSASRLVRTTAADWRRMAATTDDNPNTYLEQFGGYATGRGYSARANAELAEYVQRHTEPGDRIYIFGMAPSVYLLSVRLPANRFLWAYPAVSNAVRSDIFTLDALVKSLEASQPRVLILERNNRDSLMGWRIEENFRDPAMIRLLAGYRLQSEIEDFLIYVRDSGV